VNTPELSVVCRNCGSEVSPYVTECPYCGTRLRKRAPKLERHGDELTPHESRRQRRRRARAARAARVTERPYAVIGYLAAATLLILVQRAGDFAYWDLGAIVGSADGEWWRYLTAPFVYPDVGYWFVCAVAIAIFGTAVERRLGTVATVVLILACGALGMLAADGIESAIGSDDRILLASGGNGIALGLLAAWAVMRAREARSEEGFAFDTDVIGVAAVAAVLILLPLAEDFANVFAGLAGAIVGAACGLAASRRERQPG